jgi:hypothetical protein
MVSAEQLKADVLRVLLDVRPGALAVPEIIERLGCRDALLDACRRSSGIGARFAAEARVREALSLLGAAVDLDFDFSGRRVAGEPRVVFRAGGPS